MYQKCQCAEKGCKVLTKDISIGQSQLTKLKTYSGNIISSNTEILRLIAKLYGRFYTLAQKPAVNSLDGDPRSKLTQHYTEDIQKIAMAPKQLKNNKTLGDDRITTELLKASGKP